MAKRVALVTGSSSGIGLSTAVSLAKGGLQVVATMRDTRKAEALETRARTEGVTLEIEGLDVSSDDSVEKCIQTVLRRHARIDVLVNNAGVGYVGTTEQTPIEEFERMMDVNFMGVVRATKAVLPGMRSARSGRIISVSSVGGILGQPFNDAYCAAKFAVEGLFESLASIARTFGVHVSLVEPGPVKTEYITNLGASLNERMSRSDDPYGPLFKSYIEAVGSRYEQIGQTPDDVAAVILQAATVEAPQLRYPTSEIVRSVAAGKYTDPTGAVVLAMSSAVSGASK